MKKKTLVFILLSVLLITSCKKNQLEQEIKNSPVEIGEIKSHVISEDQAKKIAVLQSIYPEA